MCQAYIKHMSVIPVAIHKLADGIEIAWSNGDRRRYLPRQLRDACPCAVCREKSSGQLQKPMASISMPVLSPAELQPLEIVRMHPIGNYAYSIHFSDGHNSGIFTFDLLHQLGHPIAVRSEPM
ncbi:MAG: DUF971 domain-containing protein [Pirellulaceae bacterium]|nr:DUF971 domain-containing protein [Pirellulaceae bacterium]